jgi:hypothetical protein
MGGKNHDPPVTVLADEELPVLADPVDSADDPVLVDEGDGVAVAADDVIDDVDTVLVVDVPASVWYAATASAATAAVPTTPKEAVSFLRRRSARSRSAAVMRRFGAGITEPPAAGYSDPATWCHQVEGVGPCAAHHADR